MNVKDVDYYFANREIIRKRHRNLKSRSKRGDIYFHYPLKEFRLWYAYQENVCSYCSKEYDKADLEIDKINSSLGYVPFNLNLSCGRCNRIKSNIFTGEEMKEIAIKYDLKNR